MRIAMSTAVDVSATVRQLPSLATGIESSLASHVDDEREYLLRPLREVLASGDAEFNR